jgi:hypothetical protein
MNQKETSEGFSQLFLTPDRKVPLTPPIPPIETNISTEFKTPKQRTPRNTPHSNSTGLSALRSSKTGTPVPFSPERMEEFRPKPLRRITTNVLGFTFVLAILFAIYYGATMYNNLKSYPFAPYCDSEDIYEQPTNCIRCPNFGYCAEGKLLICQEPYILEGGICIKNNPSVKLNEKIANYISYKLMIRAGEKKVFFNFSR